MVGAAKSLGQPQVTLRSARPDDLAALIELSHSIFSGDGWSKDSLQNEFDLDFSYCLVATSETLLGYIIYWQVLDEIHILQVATAPTARRLGIGRKLVERCVEDARKNGAKTFLLEVRQSNLAAIGLYENAGFGPLAIRRKYYSHPVEDAVVMMRQA